MLTISRVLITTLTATVLAVPALAHPHKTQDTPSSPVRPEVKPAPNTAAPEDTSSKLVIKRMLRNDSDDLDQDSSDETGTKPLKIMKIRKRKMRGSDKAHDEDTRIIRLSEDTIAYIGEDGDIKIESGAQHLEDMDMPTDHQGRKSMMIMDDDTPSKLTIKKMVTTENGKRKVHVEIDMVQDIKE